MKRINFLMKQNRYLENGSGMIREWLGIASMKSRKSFAVLYLLFALGISNVWGYTGTFSKCTGTLTSGYYVFGVVESSTMHAVNNTVGTSWIKYTDVTISTNITNPANAVVWYYDATAGTIKNVDNTNYIYWTSGNVGCCGATSYAHDVIEASTGIYTVRSHATTGRILRRNGTSGYRYYTTSTGSQQIQFYKLSASCSNKVALTKGAETNGSFTLTPAGGSSYDNCDNNFVVTVSGITPSSGYICTGVTATGGSNSVTGPDGSGNYTVTYTKGNNLSSTVTANFAAKTAASISFVNAGTPAPTTSGYYVGDSYTLPSTNNYSCNGKTFVGWSTVPVAETDIKPTSNFYEPGASATLAASQTFYAVFASVTEGTGDWEQCSSSTIADGDYLIVQSDYMMTNTLNSQRFNKTSIAISAGVISYDAKADWSAYTWHIAETSTSGIFTIKNGANYVIGTGAASKIDLVSTPANNNELFAITYQSTPGTYKIESKYNEAASVNRWLRNGGSYFACYADGGYPYLFKRGSGYGNYCTTCAVTHTVSAVVDPAGKATVTLGATTVAEGGTTTATYSGITTGYEFVNWTISGTGASLSSTTSNPTTITMGTANVTVTANLRCITPSISVQPAASTTCLVGESPSLSVTAAAGGASLNYQWKQCATIDGVYSNVASGGNSSTYSPSTASAGTTYYKCVITNAASGCSANVTSDAAQVTVNTPSNFPNNKTIFIQAHSTSAWTGGGCVKAWFHTAGGSEAAQTTYWLFDAGSPDEGKKLFAAIVPSTGNLPYLDIQRFAANCNDWWNKNGGCSYADADGSNAVRSTGKNDDASDGDFIRWNDDAVTLSLYGDPNSWGSSLASFSDQGNGVWTATYNNYAPANAAGESQDFKICTNYNGWIGNTGSNNNVTVSDMHVGSTYNIGASLDIKDHSLTLTKTFVKGTVHFDLQGHGSAISDLTNVAAGSKISAPSPAPTAAGYRFVGWYKEPACTNAWNFGSDVVNETMTLYAKWVQTFTVTYNSNGGSGTITDSNSPYDSGATVTVKSNSFTAPTGKEFNHWDTKDDDTGTDYAPAATFTISANTTLYAQWSFVNYNVTYSAPSNGNYTIKVADGTASSATKTANYNQTITIAATPSANYRFGSWTIRNTSTSADVTSTLLTGDKPTTASTTFTMPAYGVTITATFVQTHTVTWSVNGATASAASLGLASNPVVYDHGGSLVLPPTDPDAPGGCPDKVFMGWTSDPEITTETSTEPSYVSAGAAVNAGVTYRAVFADKDDTGGSGSTDISISSSWTKSGTSGGGTAGTTGVILVTQDGVTLTHPKGYISTDVRMYKEYDCTISVESPSKITRIEITTADNNYNATRWDSFDDHYTTAYDAGTSKWNGVWENTSGQTSVVFSVSEQVRFSKIKVFYTSVSYDNYITLCSSCTTPSNLAVSSITSTGGTVSWDGVSLSPTPGFKVAWNTSNSVPGSLDASNSADVAAGTSSYAITGLTPATRYYVFVKSKCNDTWSSSTNFYTNAKITYAAGTGASGSMDPKEVTYNAASTTVDACTFTAPSGKVFNGWVSNVAVTVNGGGSPTTAVPAGATINNLTAAITLTAQWRDLAVYHVTFSADNGTVAGGANQDVLEGGTLTFPNVTSTTCGTFKGWVEAAYDNTTAPSGATYHAVGDELAADPAMEGKTYYAVYRVATGAPTTINDAFTYSDFTATGVSYVSFSGVSSSSSAVYAGETAVNNSVNIQLRSSNSTSGIVSTGSGGTVKKVSVVWASGNTPGRILDIYGKNTAYSAASDLYGDGKGTKLGSITEGTSTEITIDGDYEYVGLRSSSGAAYLSSITFQWYGAPMKYQTSPACSPVVSLTSSFSSFTYVYGSGPSASQSFTVSGANLGANLVVTAPANYEVCKTSGGTYTSSVSYTPSDGTVTDQTVYIRLAGGLNVGTYNYAAASGVSAASTGATTRTAALTGSVTKAAGAIAFTNFNAVDHYEAELTGSSVDVTLTVSVTGDGSVSYTRSPAAGSSAVPATTPTTTLHTTTTGTWTVTATLTAGTNYTGSSTSCQVVVYKADRFYDNVHGNDMILKRNDTGEDHYTIPSLSDESRLLSGSCSETHYHFMGWVPESALSSLPNDAAYDAVMITGGGTQSATGTNYYAVWAEE